VQAGCDEAYDRHVPMDAVTGTSNTSAKRAHAAFSGPRRPPGAGISRGDAHVRGYTGVDSRGVIRVRESDMLRRDASAPLNVGRKKPLGYPRRVRRPTHL
jgi:hypothetical protein